MNDIKNFSIWLDKHNQLITENENYYKAHLEFLYENFRNTTEEFYKGNFKETQAIIETQEQESLEENRAIFSENDKHKDKKKKKRFGLFKKNKTEDKTEEKELQHKFEMNRIETKHKNEMMLVKKQNEEFQEKFNELMPKLHIQAQTLGVIGETELIKLFEDLKQFNLTIINLTQVDHVSDIWLIDGDHKILFVVESKNKDSISKNDIDKFENDLVYIANKKNHQQIIKQLNSQHGEEDETLNNSNEVNENNEVNDLKPVTETKRVGYKQFFKDFDNYTIVGLFVSLRTAVINQSIGSCNYSFEKTYITQQCCTKEFLSMYIQTIVSTNSVRKFDNEKYQSVIDTISDKYKNIQTIITNINMINDSANSIIQTTESVKKLLENEITEINESLVKIDTKESDVVKAEQKIIEYITSTPTKQLKVNDVKQLANNLPVFNGVKITKAWIVEQKKELKLQESK